MGKSKIGPSAFIFPMPVLLVGTEVNGKPNFITVAWGSNSGRKPPTAVVALNHIRYSLAGIKQHQVFSINIPSVDLVKEADYCGMASGAKVDKVDICRFKLFYGKFDKAPLIEQCPVNIECSVLQIVDVGSHSLVIGKVEETHISEDCLTGGKPDIIKLNPLAYTLEPSRDYYSLGKPVAKAFHCGREMEKREYPQDI